MRTKTDSRGRIWQRHEAEGCWTHGEHVIGCAGRNGSKWQIWSELPGETRLKVIGGNWKSWYEFDTLKAAMESCE